MASNPTYGGAISTAPVLTEESGVIRIGDRVSKTLQYRGLRAAIEAMAPAKGSITSDGYKILEVEISAGPAPTLTITQEPVYVVSFPGGSGGSGGAAFPPDKWSLKPSIENIPLERHQKWVALTTTEKAWWNIAFGNGDAESVEEAVLWFELGGVASSDALEFFDLKRDGNDTFRITYWKYTWIQHDSFVPAMSSGNLIETPYGPGAAYLGGSSMGWIRDPDDLDGEEGHYIITRSWTGAPTAFVTPNTFLYGP